MTVTNDGFQRALFDVETLQNELHRTVEELSKKENELKMVREVYQQARNKIMADINQLWGKSFEGQNKVKRSEAEVNKIKAIVLEIQRQLNAEKKTSFEENHAAINATDSPNQESVRGIVANKPPSSRL